MTIKLQNLTFGYSRKGARAIDDVSCVINPGLHLLMGENGAGKTTLLHLIAGLQSPTSGTCEIDGCPTRLRLPSVNSEIFFTGVNLEFPALTISEMARIHGQFYPAFSPSDLKNNLEAFGIDANQKLRSLSTGSYQKAKIAYALALHTGILLLDEPANGLDIEAKRTFNSLIASQVDSSQTVIVSTHNVIELERLFDGVIDLSHGKLLYAGTIDEITSRIRFSNCIVPPDDAIYSESAIDRFKCILPNTDGSYSEPDYQMLYMASRNPESAATIIDLLNMPDYEKR